jgi:molybdopterin converting factor small subunit
MSVRVLFFGPLAAMAGSGPHELNLPAGAVVQQMLEQCYANWPSLREWDSSLLVAVNMTYSRRDEVIQPNTEIAIMPPVQGG